MIRQFIEDNNITFDEGERNISVATVIGYAQYKNVSKLALKKELTAEIEEDNFIGQEIDRLFKYCQNKNYKAYWNTPTAKKQYKF